MTRTTDAKNILLYIWNRFKNNCSDQTVPKM